MTLERLAYLNALQYLDAQEAAELLRTGRHEIYRLVRAGNLQATKFGRKQVFSRAELDRFMAQHEHHVTDPITPAVRRDLAARRAN